MAAENPRRYTFKLYPTAQQREQLAEQCRMMAALWNACLQRQEDTRRRWLTGVRVDASDWPERGKALAERIWRDGRAHRQHLSGFELGNEISALYDACPEWRALSTWSARRVADALTKAFEAFFRRAKAGAGAQSGYPKYRSVARADWLPHRGVSGCKLERVPGTKRDWCLNLKGIDGSIFCKGKLPDVPGTKHGRYSNRSGFGGDDVSIGQPTRREARDVLAHRNLTQQDTAGRISCAETPDSPGQSEGLDLLRQQADARRRIADEVEGVDVAPVRQAADTLDVFVANSPAPPVFADMDIRRDAAGTWWVSVCVDMPERERMPAPVSGRAVVRLGVAITATIDDAPLPPPCLPPDTTREAATLQETMDGFARGSEDWHEWRIRKARVMARSKRQRREALHEWTTDIVRRARSITVYAPPSIRDATTSGKGDERNWGANVALKADFNRNVLDQAPAMVTQMLAYKAAEAGVEFSKAVDHQMTVGNSAVATAKALRRMRRAVERQAA